MRYDAVLSNVAEGSLGLVNEHVVDGGGPISADGYSMTIQPTLIHAH